MSLHTLLVSTLPLAGLGILWSLGSGPKAQAIAAEEGRQVDERPAERERWQRPAAEEIEAYPLHATIVYHNPGGRHRAALPQPVLG